MSTSEQSGDGIFFNDKFMQIIDALNTDKPVEWVTLQRGASIGITKCVIDPNVGYHIVPPPIVLTASNADVRTLDEIIHRKRRKANDK